MPSAAGHEPAARRAFVVQFRETLQQRGLIDAVLRTVPPSTQRLLQVSDGDDWVPETELVTLLEAARAVWPGGEPAWRATLEEEALRGVNRFGRVFLRFSTLAMVLAAMPQAWQFTHRTGLVTVRWEGKHAVVTYQGHPPLASTAYQELTVAVLRAVLTLNRARAEVVMRPGEHPQASFVVEVRPT